MAQTGSLANFSAGQGEANTTAASNFNQGILSGNASKISQTLAPQISNAKTSLQQDQKTAAQNGTRSGGTAASNAAAQDKVHANITNMTGALTGGAASSLASSGGSLLGTALGANEQQANMSQQQLKNWSESIGGLATTSFIGGQTGFLGGMTTG